MNYGWQAQTDTVIATQKICTFFQQVSALAKTTTPISNGQTAMKSCLMSGVKWYAVAHSTHASVEIMCMKGSGQYEKVKIPHEFGEDNMVLFQKEKEELLAWVVPFDFFEFFDE